MTAVDPGSDLHLSATYVGERARIVAQGNLDVYTAPLLRAQLIDAVDAGARRITLIVRGVNLIDSSGLSGLVFGYKLATGRGGDFALYGDEVLVARLLARTGLDRVIPLHRDLDRGGDGDGEFRATGS
jgi:anti-sigma B factor antagonist